MHVDDIPQDALAAFRRGGVIPAHPLALDASRRLDERRQRALSRYYIDAGATGLAVGVHTTQFQIRDVGLYEPVLRLAREEAEGWTDREVLMVAGAVGRTDQAVREAETARDLGYHAVLVSLAGYGGASVEELVAHCRAVAEVMPLIGFYLQPAVGGVVLPEAFWTGFAGIDNVLGIKIAPFNRYRTLAVVKGVVAAGAERRVTLYTGNDDHIVADLLTPFRLARGGETVEVRIRGGLLGHWAVWTKKAVELVGRIQTDAGGSAEEWLALDAATTDANAAFFDARNDFRGVIAGIHEVLRRQGLLEGIWCLDPDEELGPGQAAEIDRVHAAYPDLNDGAFVAANLERWLG